MKRIDVRLAFTALRTRTGLSVDGFAKLLGYGSSAELDCYEHPNGTYQHAHLPDDVIERMIENLIGEGHPAVTRDDIAQLSLAQDCSSHDLHAELVTPSLLADILVAFDNAIENIDQLKPTASVGKKARHTAILFRQLNSGEICPFEIESVLADACGGTADHRMNEAEREAVLEELVARAMLVDLIEVKAQDCATIAFLRHLLDTRYDGVELRHHNSRALSSILNQIGAIAAAHEDPRIAEADNVVMLRGFRK